MHSFESVSDAERTGEVLDPWSAFVFDFSPSEFTGLVLGAYGVGDKFLNRVVVGLHGEGVVAKAVGNHSFDVTVNAFHGFFGEVLLAKSVVASHTDGLETVVNNDFL